MRVICIQKQLPPSTLKYSTLLATFNPQIATISRKIEKVMNRQKKMLQRENIKHYASDLY